MDGSFTEQSQKLFKCLNLDFEDIHPALQWVKYKLSPKKRDTPESLHKASSPHPMLPQMSTLLHLLPANTHRIKVIGSIQYKRRIRSIQVIYPQNILSMQPDHIQYSVPEECCTLIVEYRILWFSALVSDSRIALA